MTGVIFDPEAQLEFLEVVRYYEECRPGLGLRFLQGVESASENIMEAPFRYRVLKSPFRRYLLPKFPYAIIYTIEPDHIRILAVAHTKRKPGYWLSRPDGEEARGELKGK